MTSKKFTRMPRGNRPPIIELEIDLRVFSDEAAAAVAEVLAPLDPPP